MDSETVTCPQCGNSVPTSALLCPKCGRPNISTAFAGTYSATPGSGALAPAPAEPAAQTVVPAKESGHSPRSELPVSLQPSTPFVLSPPANSTAPAPDSSPQTFVSGSPPPPQPDRTVSDEPPVQVRHIPDPSFEAARHQQQSTRPGHSAEWYARQAPRVYKSPAIVQPRNLYNALIVVIVLASITLCASFLDTRCLYFLVFLVPTGVVLGSALYRQR
jgi:hypothetical protein